MAPPMAPRGRWVLSLTMLRRGRSLCSVTVGVSFGVWGFSLPVCVSGGCGFGPSLLIIQSGRGWGSGDWGNKQRKILKMWDYSLSLSLSLCIKLLTLSSIIILVSFPPVRVISLQLKSILSLLWLRLVYLFQPLTPLLPSLSSGTVSLTFSFRYCAHVLYILAYDVLKKKEIKQA